MVRVYYNSSDNGKRKWSIDRGVGTEEINVDSISLECKDWYTAIDEYACNIRNPKAWLENFDNPQVYIHTGKSRISVIIK